MLNHILTAKHGQRIAVIENEFGAVGIGKTKKALRKALQGDEMVQVIKKIVLWMKCQCCMW